MKRIFIMILALCLTLSLTACGKTDEANKGEEKDTVTLYVVTEQKSYYNGEVSKTATFTYDDHGRPLAVHLQWQDQNRSMHAEITYDEYGNPIKEVTTNTLEDNVHETDNSYDLTYTDGVITHVECAYGGFNLEYDRHGNLTLIRYDDTATAQVGLRWHSFSYDSESRLVDQIQCVKYPIAQDGAEECRLTRVSYQYDAKGRLVTLKESSSTGEENITPENALDLDFMVWNTYTYCYDDDGRLCCISDDEDSDYSIYEDDYYTFDEHGNLTVEGSDDNRVEYTYKAIEVSKEDAEHAKQLMHGFPESTAAYYVHASMDPVSMYVGPMILYAPNPKCSVYYLVPNPCW